MTLLDLNPDQLLSTTRAVRRRLDFDRPVEMKTIEECLELALQAPSGSNAQGWHFVVVTDAEKKTKIGELYRQAFSDYRNMPFSAHALRDAEGSDSSERGVMDQVVSSAEYLAENLERSPALLIPCVAGRVENIPGTMGVLSQASTYGSILPAVWSFMLAARARGLGTSWTTLHLMHEEAIAELLGIPFAEFTQVALSPIAYTVGTEFKAAKRKPLGPILHVDAW